MDDLFAMLINLPRWLAAGWGLWFAVGLGLSIWSRREKMHVWAEPEVESLAMKPPTQAERQARQQAKAPHSAGEAFGELEALLDQQTQGQHRMPGEAPSVEAPSLAEAPRLAAPQSLP
jgi:hypothetical protein